MILYLNNTSITLDFYNSFTDFAVVPLQFGTFMKLRKTKSINAWKNMTFSIENQVYTNELFKNKLNLFWNNVADEFTENNHMFILLKIKYIGADYITVGKLQRLNQNDKNWYLNWILNNMINKTEYYLFL
jgi:hypothetical protein